MSKATRSHNTPPAAAAATQEPPSPEFITPRLLDLGRFLAATNAAWSRIDARGDRWPIPAASAKRMLTAREGALERIITTIPADTLTDAAVQIGAACSLCGILDASDWRGAADLEYLEELIGAVYRVSLSVLPVVAAAAGLSVAEMGWTDVLALRAHHFATEESLS